MSDFDTRPGLTTEELCAEIDAACDRILARQAAEGQERPVEEITKVTAKKRTTE